MKHENVDCSDLYIYTCAKTCAIHLCHAHLRDVFPCACVHAMDILCACNGHLVCMQWTCFGSITTVFSLVCAPAIYMCSILVPIHLCVSITCAVAMYLSGVYLCQFTSAEIVAFHIQVCRQRCLCTCGKKTAMSTLDAWLDGKNWTLANMLWVTCDLFTFTCCYLGYFIYYMGNPQTWTLLHETYCCLWSSVVRTMFTVTCAAISILLRI